MAGAREVELFAHLAEALVSEKCYASDSALLRATNNNFEGGIAVSNSIPEAATRPMQRAVR